ncbi:MAG TPA: magnesium/cobalt transporter CorA [Paludibacteraceae bacterium]|jgi:magnesium transporter|nr:magnesium/cobalt transporter CorA [Paludibacteraceae bacterium]HOU68422.1 magnesium/cobalt transporter CorA [Paludibacteraceae bacterium]HPH63335.1 magnesium/cobalt transporter CorA [Paludibacteraceae bacterium]HQF50289.1 magnesium/cobalt transporter CorA [Paludibacteraceae bacterium]HQJ90167.1 magnesium/cobalt transporter CorA [Paludibacteraceae bacterium]
MRLSEVRLFYFENNRLKIAKDIDILKTVPLNNFVWIDLNNVEPETESELEQFLKIYIQEEEEIEEIEISSRFMETEDTLVANSNFLLDSYEKEPVSFILKNDILVSVRDTNLKSFNETVKKMFANPKNYPTGFHIFIALLETRVEYDADMIEDATSEITKLSKTLTVAEDIDEDMLLEIKNLQEKVMHLRENIIDKHRVVSSVLRSALLPNDLKPRLTLVIKDINSLIEHTKFGFERLDYLQDTFLGLVNIEQNKIIKIFTVVSVIFLPPTLIASIYGMNFKFMPELSWSFGYPFSLILMVVFSGLTLLYFKKRNWL